jgi:hypothetical protein
MFTPMKWTRNGWRTVVLLAISCSAAATTPRYEWSRAAFTYFQNDPKGLAEAAPTRAFCAQAIASEPPAADRPSPAQAKALAGCDSEALYYGIGRAADPVSARRCAILERDGEEGEQLPYFSGSGILAVAYANGQGASRDLKIATHMACGIDDAVAATQARVTQLQKLASSTVNTEPFGICDHATSGISGGVCAAHDAELENQVRARGIADLERGWTKERIVAFNRTYASARAYAELSHELDCYRGTGAVGCTIAGTQRDLGRFLAKVKALLRKGSLPIAPTEQDRANAATAPRAWRQLVAELPADDRETYVDNGKQVVAARAKFERDLLAFSATIPGSKAHEVRSMFADF